MAFDPNDPADAAAVKALVDAATVKVAADHAPKLAELAQARDAEKARADRLDGELTTTKATAAQTLADYNAAKAAGDSTAAELATLKAAADVAAKAADKSLIESLPEPVRKLAPAGLAGAALAEWVTAAKAAVSEAPTGLGGGTGAVDVPTADDIAWGAKNYPGLTGEALIKASTKIGPRSPTYKPPRLALVL